MSFGKLKKNHFFFFCLFCLGLHSRRVQGVQLSSGAVDYDRVRSGVKDHCGRQRSEVKGYCGQAAFAAFGAFECVWECIREPAAR